MAFSTQIPIKTLLLGSTLPDAIGAYPNSIPCNTLPSSFWAQPSAQQQTGDFPHSIPQNRRASVSDTETGQSLPQAYTLTTQRKRPGPSPALSQARAWPMDLTRLALFPPTVGAAVSANEDPSPPAPQARAIRRSSASPFPRDWTASLPSRRRRTR